MDDLQFGTRNKRGDWAPSAHLELPPFWRRPFSLPQGSGLDSGIPVALERLPHGDGAALVVLRRARCRDDADPVLGLGAVALRRECGRDLRLLRLGRAVLVRQAQAGHPVQVQRQVPGRSALGRVLVQEPEHRQLPAVVLRLDPALDAGRGAVPVGLRQWLCAVADLGRPSGLAGACWPCWRPAIHEVHFFCIHRLIHTPFLYKWVHSVHHNSVNPSPWSSLSMHPVEGFLYHAVAFWHL